MSNSNESKNQNTALELARKAYGISNNAKEIANKITDTETFEAISGSPSEPLKSYIYEPLISPLIALLSTFKVVTLRAFDHILASAIGGTLTALSVTPLDVVKVRLQAQVDPLHAKPLPAHTVPLSTAAPPVRLNGTIDAILKIAKLEGVTSLWRGLVPTLVMTVPGVALYFTSYEKFKAELSGLGHLTPLVAGAAARTVTATLTSPLELFRTNIQSHNRNISALTLAKQIVSQGKFSHLWIGLGPTLFRDVPFSSIYWGLYEFTKHQLVTKRHIENQNLMKHTMRPLDGSEPKVIRTFYDTFLIPFISGATAGAIAATVTVPFDVIKTRMQMDVDVHGRKTQSAVQLFMQVARNEGMRGLMKGAVPRATRVAPACAIMISSYELFSRFLLKRKKAEEEKKRNMNSSDSNSTSHSVNSTR